MMSRLLLALIEKAGRKVRGVGRLLLLFVFVGTGCAFAGSGPEYTDVWSNYRGANRDGVSSSSKEIQAWTAGSPIKLVWKQKMGDGFSGIVVDGSQLITAFTDGKSELMGSFDRQTGKENWHCEMGKVFVEEFGNGPRSTPTVDGQHAFVLNSWGQLFAVNKDTGKLDWMSDLSGQFKIEQPRWGHSTSPIVYGEEVIVHMGGGAAGSAFVALDKKTGEIRWKTGSSVFSYSSPFMATIDNVPQLIVSSTHVVEVEGKKKGVNEILGLSPEGKQLWVGPSLPGVIAMPVFIPPNRVFVSSSNDVGCLAMEIKKSGNAFKAEQVWFSNEMQNHFNSTVYFEGHLYGFSNATLHCLDAGTGVRKWRKRGMGKGSLIIADHKLIILSDRGVLAIAEANPDKYVELAKAKVIEGLTWTSPTLADGFLYLRSREEMACYDLSKQ